MTNKFSNIKDRVLYLAEAKQIGKKKFCESIGMTYSNFTGKAKDTPLNSTAIANILTTIPDVNPLWLLLGEGEIFQENQSVDSNIYEYLKEKDKKIEQLLQENIRLKIELEMQGAQPDAIRETLARIEKKLDKKGDGAANAKAAVG